MLTQAGPSPGQTSLAALQTDHSALERSRRPGRRGHLRAHVRVRAGVGAPNRAHQGASVLIGPGAVPENQRTLVARVPSRAGADRRAVRVGESVRGVGAAGCEGRAVGAGLGPAVVPAEAVGLMGRVAGLQVGQGGKHARDSGGGHVDRRAGRGVHVIPGVVCVRGLVGGQGQALIHVTDLVFLRGICGTLGWFRLVSVLQRWKPRINILLRNFLLVQMTIFFKKKWRLLSKTQ